MENGPGKYMYTFFLNKEMTQQHWIFFFFGGGVQIAIYFGICLRVFSLLLQLKNNVQPIDQVYQTPLFAPLIAAPLHPGRYP